MKEAPPDRPVPKGKPWLRLAVGVLLLAGLTVGAVVLMRSGRSRDDIPPSPTPPPTKDLVARTQVFCGKCHAFPPPSTFPQSAWEKTIDRMFQFFHNSGWAYTPPNHYEVVQYYREHAPPELPPAEIKRADHPLPVELQRIDYLSFAGPPSTGKPHISNINLVHLFDQQKLDVLACEMESGCILVLQPYLPQPQWHKLYDRGGKNMGFNPAHTEVVDLDKDGNKDILVANLGSFPPTDRHVGEVLWLRGRKDGTFQPYTLLKNKGRIADVQAADFNGDGKLDLIVACFGWNEIGEVCYLENRTTDWNKPKFQEYRLDERHGAIHVPITDLDGDGKPDFIALFAQEHETIVAFLNRIGKGGDPFEQKTLFKAPHPGYGSSGIQLVDLDKDGDLDILYTNGDTLDEPYLLKPYHGIQWLENKGNLEFVPHRLEPMYGVHRAVAADLDGDGDLDIVAVSFLPPDAFPQRQKKNVDSILVLEQTSPGVFARHTLESVSCDHVSCAVGDVFGRGKIDVVTGNFTPLPMKNAITIWKTK